MSLSKTATRAWLAAQTRLSRRGTWTVVLWGIAGTVASAAQAILAGDAIAALLLGGRASWPVLGGFAGLAVARAAFALIGERAAFEAGAAARRRIRTTALGRLLEIGPPLLRSRHSAELVAIAVDRIEALDGYFGRWLPAATLAVAGPAIVLAVALWLDPWSALILFCAGLLVPVAMAVSGIGASVAARRQLVALDRLKTRFVDRVRGIATIVLAGRGEDEALAIGVAADELRRRTMRVLRVAFLSSTALDLAAVAAIVLIAIRAQTAPALSGAQGARFAELLLAAEFFVPLRAFAVAYQDRSSAEAAAEAVAGLPPAPETVPAPAPPVRTVQARGVAVAFEDVRLSWDPSRPPALDGVGFRVAAGETLILVGPSGAGKSSVLEILLGFVRPDAGRATLNGMDVSAIVPQALSRLTGWIGQRPMIFAATIEDNIRFARPEASEAELTDAIRAARLESVLAGLPDGLRTAVGEGGYGLSGGQAQRIAIARAFLKNAPLLLLDEPTSHLDPATEAEVLDSLRRLAIGRTVILASHAAAVHAFPGRRLNLRDGRVLSFEPARGAA